MKYYIIAFFLLTSSYGVSQCNFKTNEVDEFNGTRTQILESQTVASKQSGGYYEQIDFSIARVDSLMAILMAYNRSSASSMRTTCLNVESKLFLKTTTGKIITLPYFGETECSSTFLAGMFLITEDDIIELKGVTLVKVRLQTTDHITDFDIVEKLKKNYFLAGNKNIDPRNYFQVYLNCFK
jgi:hypothetical protein